MKRLKILLYADSYNGKVGQGANYVAFLSQFGEVILVSSDNELDDFVKLGDILALPGGADVDPMRYNERPHHMCGRPNAQYEYLDKFLLEPWLKTGKPVIGICRGLQTLNVALGGTLWQDLTNHVGGEDRTYLGHKLYTTIKGSEIIDVNSYHHQGIKKLAPDCVAIGWSMLYKYCPTSRNNEYYMHKWVRSKEKQGKILKSKELYSALVEVFTHKTKPYVAFQYHPEDYNCPFAIDMIEDTIKKYYPTFKADVKHDLNFMGAAGGFFVEQDKVTLNEL